ncbi:uncharacterized protein BDW47DRAFT_22905 [Aspergillus candidus]|uniref:Uncharacterized protein n=1 Tax=Aspergillus candidus TaxID=41067 RepID=A0A2I2FCU9_ASPCN|nr:hypothetical protein BDW47DRAFT_22905 [Aspergillus candidus]PLB38452.1 hypothetical protein BDW47DRAFT_22905 [Aspergillus candidus]
MCRGDLVLFSFTLWPFDLPPLLLSGTVCGGGKKPKLDCLVCRGHFTFDFAFVFTLLPLCFSCCIYFSLCFCFSHCIFALLFYFRFDFMRFGFCLSAGLGGPPPSFRMELASPAAVKTPCLCMELALEL